MLRPQVCVALIALSLVARAAASEAQSPRRGGVIRVADREAPGLDPQRLLHTWLDR
jgi:hypothetical protein